jgi:hypothetical protein
MDIERKKKFISAMLLYCLSGDIAARINYGGILISRIEDYLVNDVVLVDPNHSYLVRILTSVDKVVESALIIKQKNLASNDLSELKRLVIEKTFQIDEAWSEKNALAGIVSLGDLSDIRIARSYFYAAAEHFPSSNQSASAASEAIKNMDRAMQKIMDICDHYNLIEFEANEWRENITTHKVTE